MSFLEMLFVSFEEDVPCWKKYARKSGATFHSVSLPESQQVFSTWPLESWQVLKNTEDVEAEAPLCAAYGCGQFVAWRFC